MGLGYLRLRDPLYPWGLARCSKIECVAMFYAKLYGYYIEGECYGAYTTKGDSRLHQHPRQSATKRFDRSGCRKAGPEPVGEPDSDQGSAPLVISAYN